MSSIVENISEEVRSITRELIEMRRDLHKHPEICFEERRTAQVVAQKLRDLCLEVETGIAKTGVVGLLRGNSPGRTIMLRADMDALPIAEENQVEYRSENRGVMHACGHDGHTSIALGVASILAKERNSLRGNVKFVFQPAEERIGGAPLMIEEGVLENPKVDAAFALHLWNDLPVGKIGVRAGPIMATTGEFIITVKGKGGHGAAPHQTVDSIVVAAHVVTALQAIVSRNIDPLKPVVLTIGMIQGGDTFNVIADQVVLKGTLRSFDPNLRDELPKLMERTVSGVTDAMGAKYIFSYERHYEATVNDEKMTDLVREIAKGIVGSENVILPPQAMAGEDMSFFLRKVPGCYFFVGSANPQKELVNPHHSPRFDFDEDAMPIGVEIMLRLVRQYLGLVEGSV